MKHDLNLRKRLILRSRLLTASRRPLPDILILGAQKSGTTSLFNYLIKHPRIRRGRTKEVHYFDLNHDKEVNWYRAQYPLFLSKKRMQSFSFVDASPLYFFHGNCPERAHRVVPDARLIILLRCPIERAYSHYQHAFKRGYESRPCIQAIEEELSGIDPERPIAPLPRETFFHFRQRSYIRRGIYAPQISRWLAYFSREALLILDANQFFLDTRRVMSRVFSHLGHEDHPSIDENTVYKRGQYDSLVPDDVRKTLEAFYLEHNNALENLTGSTFSWVSREQGQQRCASDSWSACSVGN